MELPGDVRIALAEFNKEDHGSDAAIWSLGSKNVGLDQVPIWALGRRLDVHPELRAAAALILDDNEASDEMKHHAFHLYNGLKPTFVREGRVTVADVQELRRLRFRWMEQRKDVEAEMDTMLSRSKHVHKKKEARVKYIQEMLDDRCMQRFFCRDSRSQTMPGKGSTGWLGGIESPHFR